MYLKKLNQKFCKEIVKKEQIMEKPEEPEMPSRDECCGSGC
jgi:hypothetical protein